MESILCPSFSRSQQLMQLSDEDIFQFVYELNKQLLTYREKLSFPTNYTFGTELEFENVAFSNACDQVVEFNRKWGHPVAPNYYGWYTDLDTSVIKELHKTFYGGEVDSPIMRDTKQNWIELKEMCELLKSMGATTTEKTSSHVHVCAEILGDDIENWITLLKMWVIYEDVIFKFSMGDKLYLRKHAEIYAQSCRKEFQASITRNEKDWRKNPHYLFDDICDSDRKKKSALEILDANPKEYERKNTIEFRSPNGSLEPVILQNNIQFFVHFLRYIGSDKCDRKWIDKKFRTSLLQKKIQLESSLIERSIELADLIYESLDDKCYFLSQCWKGFEKQNPKERQKTIQFYQKM